MLHSEFLLDQRPDVGDAHAARGWLHQLPLSDARVAHHAIETLLDSFDENGLALRRRLDILETVRAQAAEIDARYARRYTSKALPLGAAGRTAYRHAVSLWQKQESCYWDCARAAAAGDPTLAPHLALCLARAASLACERIMGALRAGQPASSSASAALARYATCAREHGVLDTPLPDSLHVRGKVSVASVQQRGLLLALTGSGAGLLSGRERDCAFELAAQWETKLSARWLPADLTRALTRDDLPPAADEARQRVRVARQGGQIYFLDVTALSRSLRKRIHLAAAGKAADELKLPASFPPGGAGALLTRLHGIWCEDGFGRRYPRSAAACLSGTAPGGPDAANFALVPSAAEGAATGALDAMACLISGAPFGANDDANLTSRSRFDEIFVFQGGGQARRERQLRAAQGQAETWRCADQSAGGMRLQRSRAAAPAAHCKPGQLLALRSSTGGPSSPAQLAELRWCAEQPEGSPAVLEAGVEVIAQAPTVTGVRLTGAKAAGAQLWTAAFLCGNPMEGHALITPPGWHRPGRIIELLAGKQIERWLLGPLKRRGADYEMIEAARTQ